MEQVNYDKIREMIARCRWTYAKTMPWAPHEYIVRGECPLTEEEFLYFIDMQRRFGVQERWGSYNLPYLYIDDYKYWTMGASYDETTIINRAKTDVLGDTLSFCGELKRIREDVRENQPFLLNVLLEAQPNEEGVSRILKGFFSYRQDGEYVALRSFVRKFLNEELASQIKKPVLQEEEYVTDQKRIDILVYEKAKYAIVFENKIWDATEQENQLSNYIRGLKDQKYGLTDDQVYIIYLPSDEGHGPTDRSWDKNIQKLYKNRYCKVSFKEGIIRWLDSEEMKSIGDPNFSQSRFLFSDYLKRVFNLTPTDNMEQREIDKHIKSRLDLNGDRYHDMETLNETIKRINGCVKELERNRRMLCCDAANEWMANLERDFPDLEKHSDIRLSKYIMAGVILPYKEYKKGIIVLLEFIGQDLIYGALYTDDTKKIRVEMQESDGIQPFYKSKEFTKGVDWLFYKSTSLEDAYDNLKNLIERMTNQIG